MQGYPDFLWKTRRFLWEKVYFMGRIWYNANDYYDEADWGLQPWEVSWRGIDLWDSMILAE